MSASEGIVNKPKRFLGIRHVQAFMLFLALVISFSIKVIMSMAVVAMTDPHQKNHFDWDTRTQSVVLSSFFWGYIILPIPGGEIARRFSGKFLVTLSIAINSAVCFIIPIGALYGGWKVVCACRFIQGLSQGFLTPSCHSLISCWAPLGEKSRTSSFIYSGAQLGTAIQLIASGFIAATWSWQGIFYTNGIVGAIWTVAYMILGSNSPQQSNMISTEEKLYIQNSLGHVGGKKRMKTPWKNIWTSVPFISLIIVHCGENWGFWTLATEIPSYMSQVLGVNVQQNGMMSALPYLAMYLISFPMGFASDYIIKKKWLSITASRKISNSIGHFGPALALVGLSFVPPGEVRLAVAVLTLAVGLNAGLFTGFLIIHIDMAPNFAGALMGVTMCISNIVSLISPLVAGIILKDQTNASDWQKVFYVAAAIYVIGNLIFLIFGTSEKQKWNDIEETPIKENTAANIDITSDDLAPNTTIQGVIISKIKRIE